jgi:hypothetical protein
LTSGDRHPDVDDIIGCKMKSCHMKPSGKYHGISKTKLRAIVHETKKGMCRKIQYNISKFRERFQDEQLWCKCNHIAVRETSLCTIGTHWDEN